MFSGGNGADRSSKDKASRAGNDASFAGDSRDKDSKRRKGISSPSILSADLKILGDVETAGDLHIDGVILGDVRSRRVTVGKDGEVQGAILGQEVTIRGLVRGEIVAQSVVLAKTARVEATVFHELLAVEPGAELLGRTTRRAPGSGTEALEKPPQAAALPAPESAPQERAPQERAPEESAETVSVPPKTDEPDRAEAQPAATAGAAKVNPVLSDEVAKATPVFEPLPAILAAGPADIDGSLTARPEPEAKGDDPAKPAGDDSGSSRTGIRFRPLGATQATP